MKTESGKCWNRKEDWAYFINEKPIELLKTRSYFASKKPIPPEVTIGPNYIKGVLVFAETCWPGVSKTYFRFVRDGKLEDFKEDPNSVDSFLVSSDFMEEFIPYMECGRISGYFGWKKIAIDMFVLVYLGDEL